MDLDLLQILQSNLKDIGVNMEIRQMEYGAYDAYTNAMKHDQMVYSEESGLYYPPMADVINRHSTMSPGNLTANNDPVLDKMAESWLYDAKTLDEAIKKFKEVDLYVLSKHWDLYVFPRKTYTLWQPSVQGYAGESFSFMQGWNFARMWKK